jgi:hypothetical protein
MIDIFSLVFCQFVFSPTCPGASGGHLKLPELAGLPCKLEAQQLTQKITG